MRILTIILIAALVGSAIGGSLGYIEVSSERKPVAAATGDAPAVDVQAKAGRVVVDEPHFNFGRMERGREKSHEFVLRNVGNAPVRVWAGQTTCKCTLSEVESGNLAPGESTKVKLEWSAKSDQGPFRQSATIHTTNPAQPDIELTIDGEIVEASGVEPPDFAFDKVAVGETKSADVYVMAMLQDTLDVSSYELTNEELRDKFDVKIEKLPPDQLPNKTARDGVRVTLTAKPGIPLGRFNQYLTLNTSLNEGEKLHIPVNGRVVGDISIAGVHWLEDQGVLQMGRVQQKTGKKSRLNLYVRGENPEEVKFELSSSDPPELKVAFGEPKRLKDNLLLVPMEVEVPAGTRPMVRLATAQGEEGRIVLKTTHPTMKEVALGVRFAVEK